MKCEQESMNLEKLTAGILVTGISANGPVEIVAVKWFGTSAVEITYKMPNTGAVDNCLIDRSDVTYLRIVERKSLWSFDGDGYTFRLVSEALRIYLAHLFDPVLAVHTSDVEPLPHQITAVYDAMLPRQPLKFLLADDPGAGKTIMSGLLIKELKARGDLERCLVVCPGSLAEQWQDELGRRFQLPFEIMTNDKIETAPTGNWFSETPLVIARLDKLARNDDSQALLKARDGGWDLIICDEAHKMSASFFGGEVKYTKRYKLGTLLSSITRHFLLLTATPHNGKEEDFQLFMKLLDPDRFEGRFREDIHTTDVSDLMRRMVKENLYTFDAKPLFPERRAHALSYKLSDKEACLYNEVTNYVRKEFNRAEALENDNRARNIGFALTILQRRLASSPEAIYKSLGRRREKLEKRLYELRSVPLDMQQAKLASYAGSDLDEEDIEDMDDAIDDMSNEEEEILDRVTAARTADELESEINSLMQLETLAQSVRMSGEDRKWRELTGLLREMFDDSSGTQKQPSSLQKLVIFTEHRDTLYYLYQKITTLLGREDAVVMIHGGVKREERRTLQGSFLHDPNVCILLANDAASEGINLQRAHFMVNYDLPWNPNRIEQRFGRIHRIGQTEVCELWNMIAEDTKEGEVYNTLLTKLEKARKDLGGQVFDVLGKMQFKGKPLRTLLLEAIRYGERPEIQEKLNRTVSDAFDREHVQSLLDESSLARESLDTSKVYKIREDMERAEARRLQPHYIQSFFAEAFGLFGGKIVEREDRRYQIIHVPVKIREHGRTISLSEPILRGYERIVFEKTRINLDGKPQAEFVCPGHPLLDAVIDLALEQYDNILRQGSVLVDDNDTGNKPRVLVYMEHSVQDESTTSSGKQRTVSKRMHYVEIDESFNTVPKNHAPYLDYRPLNNNEPTVQEILNSSECKWIEDHLEDKVVEFAASKIAPVHLAEIRSQRLEHLSKTEAAVKERLTKEIAHWYRRSEDLKEQEKSGKTNARLNSDEASRKAGEFQTRLDKRLGEIAREKKLSMSSPIVRGGVLVVPIGLIRKVTGIDIGVGKTTTDTQEAAANARAAVMEVERHLGHEPTDRELDKLGYDIESRMPGTGRLRLIEVKGRIHGAATITVTKNEILTCLNKPDDYILAIVEFEDGKTNVRYVRNPFGKETDFGVTSVNYNMSELLARSEDPS